ncbi:chitin synthase chs-2 [Condylostylus longicornis]|uniref:chitin synthase chs-2 n=1 Tax=Condylostylus longicornis TaxID=2530218 RepID=UPI00244DCADD|nr:chitin synthase chs-2 [Condylostylus longicornis]
MNFDINDDDPYDEEIILRKRNTTSQRKSQPLWDSFEDPPPEVTSGSLANWNKFGAFLKFLKIITYITVFSIILVSSIVSKNTYILMTSQLQLGHNARYCDIRHPDTEKYAFIPEKQRISWVWTLIFSFAVPEIFTFLRVARVCFFKNVRFPTVNEMVLIGGMETLHTFGLAMLTFSVLPLLDSARGLMLANCVCLVPAIIGLFSGIGLNCKSLLFFILGAIALCAQVTGFLVWPFLGGQPQLWLLIPALILISFRWWENYCAGLPSSSFLRYLVEIRQQLIECRPYIYLFVAPFKIIFFAIASLLLDGQNFKSYFEYFLSGWYQHDIIIKNKIPLFTDQNTTDSEFEKIKSEPMAHIWIFIIHIFTSYLCYITAKFACKIKIQEFSFALPLTLAGPFSLGLLLSLSGIREMDVCVFHNYFPDYLAFRGIPIYNVWNYILDEYIYVWVIWWISQLWITRHIWKPKNDRNASTEKLFICPWYCSFLIDQCISMNRRVLDQEKFVEYMDSVTFVSPENTKSSKRRDSEIKLSDSIPQLIVCATMWHENEEEMMEFLKSILRLDEDQCARRMARKYLNNGKYDEEYYELEINIFFDDAFIIDKRCEDPENPPINMFVKSLVESIEKAAEVVYNTKIKIKPPTKIKTPYGGRLIWTLPGRTKMIAHLKNKDKIRHKKRWSQVMYMYYLLGFRIMEMDGISPKRKIVIAQNTFILALDGDIDFQPQAVHLLIGRMRVDPDLGAACGRIHPVGKGPMVWYQVFEYAIGHWLQKATEHVIGCVLCSPGCFSLFRGRALMENSVMKKYTTVSKEARHYVQYDQGEDRWLCTLLLKQKFRVEYSAASDAYTHAPENFNEFYNQRRRWVPSTIANIFDLLGDAKLIVKNNNSISTPYIIYQGMLMVGTILGPGTIFLMVIGAAVAVFSVDIWTSFIYNVIPVAGFMLICFFMKQKYQLIAAFIISSLYCLVMMAVIIGIAIQMLEDSIYSPTSLFFLSVVLQITITGVLHPQEFGALWCGIIYFITIPSMYMLLLIYSVFNMNDVSWGTRDIKPPQDQQEDKNKSNLNDKKMSKFQQLFYNLKPNKDEEGSFDLACSGLFRCMFCTHQKTNTTETQLLLISESLTELNTKLRTLEMKLSGEIVVMSQPSEENIHEDPNKKESEENEKTPPKEEIYEPGWLDDPLLNDFQISDLSPQETKFWEKLIEKYLRPLFQSDDDKNKVKEELKGLRDIVCFAFVMINALFVLVVLILQSKKSVLHFIWPFHAKDTITFNERHEVMIFREHLELDPIGLCFVLLFGLILFIQFVAMLFHRFATISQILATTQLNIFCCGSNDDDNEDTFIEELRGTTVEIAKKSQKPKRIDEDDSDVEDNSDEPIRRNTIYRLTSSKAYNDPKDWSDLQTNFERRFEAGKLKYNEVPLRRKTITRLENNRKSVIERRRTVLNERRNNLLGNGYINGNDNPAFVSDYKTE